MHADAIIVQSWKLYVLADSMHMYVQLFLLIIFVVT